MIPLDFQGEQDTQKLDHHRSCHDLLDSMTPFGYYHTIRTLRLDQTFLATRNMVLLRCIEVGSPLSECDKPTTLPHLELSSRCFGIALVRRIFTSKVKTLKIPYFEDLVAVSCCINMYKLQKMSKDLDSSDQTKKCKHENGKLTTFMYIIDTLWQIVDILKRSL